MKKLITIVLLCAMLLTTLASCGMKAGDVDVDAYAAEGEAADVAFKTELDANASVWDESTMIPDGMWYTGEETVYEISTAAELMGFKSMLDGNSLNTVIFDGITFKLTNDIDLNGASWRITNSTKQFGGTFDGQGHVIANYTYDGSGTNHSFFGSVGGNATIKNLSLVEAVYTDTGLTGGTNNCATVVSRVFTTAGSTITLSNIYTAITYNGNSGNYTVSRGGALVPIVEGDGDIVVENCQNNNTVNINGGTMAGIIGRVDGARNVTVRNCQVTGSFSCGSTENGGIIGLVKAITGDVLIEDCVVSGTFKTNGQAMVGGILGETRTTGNITIRRCKANIDLNGGAQTGGIIGHLAKTGTASTVLIEDCDYNGDLVATTMSGGILGYVDKPVTSLTISNCNVTGSVTTERTGGGIAGTINTSNPVVIKNCSVNAELTFNLADTKNNCAGGLVGKLQSSATIDNCFVNAAMEFTHAPSGDPGESDGVSGAGGLIGRIFTEATEGITVTVANSTVAGSLYFNDVDDDYRLNAGRLVGSKADLATLTFLENNTVAETLAVTTSTEGDTVVDALAPAILPVGYQIRDNGNGTYDLRFVFAIKDVYEGYGVNADIAYLDGSVTEKSVTSYATTVYKAVKGETEKTYTAANYGYDYLYTVVVKNVPNAINEASDNLYVSLEAFGENEGDAAPTVLALAILGTALN